MNLPGNDLPSPTPVSLDELLQTEQMVLDTQPPASNLTSLAQRLKGVVVTQPARTTPLNRQVGAEDTFWVYDQDTGKYSQERARLVYVTSHAYMYVQDGQPFNLTALQLSAQTFEQTIYPTLTTDSGSPWTPGIDDDVHITILNTVGLGANVGGFFSALDEYAPQVNPYSNQREMFYINLNGELPGSVDYNSVMANELQRLIDWHQHPQAPDWLNEGLALLAQHLNGYPTEGVEETFLQNPNTQLTSWSADPSQEPAYAGASYLFLDFFIEHYGGPTILKALLQDPANPPADFNDVLTSQGYGATFTDVFQQWLATNFVADPSIDKGEYGYSSLYLPNVMPQQTVTDYPITIDGQVSQDAAQYYALKPSDGRSDVLNLQFAGAPTVRLVGNNPQDSTDEWWGNRGNTMDSTLTRSFNLSGLKGKHVTLQFSTWYDLEQDHDYAFVEVSTDGGQRWRTLQGSATTASNLNGLNWGQGYTGISGGSNTPAWVQQSIDLTPYAGKRIQLRFEQVTDNALSSQGFALGQISIPQLNFQDTISSNNGWVSHGFIRSNNILPEHYLVQALIYTGATFTIQNVTIDLASGRGELTTGSFGRQITEVVLVVSASAPQTTLQAHYELDLRTT
jgi:hypothetical protein